MANLSGQSVSQNYKGILNLHTLNGGLTTSLQAVEDGAGVASPFELSTLGISVDAGATYMYGGVDILKADNTLNNYMLFGAGNLTMTGQFNTLVGYNNSNSATTAIYNSIFGYRAGQNITSANHISAFGYGAATSATTGTYLNAFGVSALANCVDGSDLCAYGYDTLRFAVSSIGCVAFGNHSQEQNLGNYNTSVGTNSFDQNTTGQYGSVFGYLAARFQADGTTPLTTSSNSVYIGALVRGFSNSDNNSIVIGYNAIGAGANTVVLGNTSIIKTILRGTVNMANLPTSMSGLVSGDLWNNSGVLNII